MGRLKLIAPRAIVVLTGLAGVLGYNVHGQVLAVDELTRKIAALSVPREDPILERRKAAQIVEDDLSQFIVHRLRAPSSASACDLESQLRTLFQDKTSVSCHELSSGPIADPQVFMQEIGRSQRQVAVIYKLSLGCMVQGCTVPVFENYVFENGEARRTSRLDSLLNGYLIESELLSLSPETHQFWVLLSAMMSGSSGRLIGKQALLLQIGTDSINVHWQSPVLGNLEVHRVESSDRWELEYVDGTLYPSGPDKHVIDVYRFDKPSREVQRILQYHQP